MWIVQKSPTVTNWKTVYRSPSEEAAREIFTRQLQVHCTGKFRLVDPTNRTVEFELARTIFA